jgi:hypothetical protein
LAVLLIRRIRKKSIITPFSQTTAFLLRNDLVGIVLVASIFEEKIPGGVLFQRELLGEPLLWFTKRFSSTPLVRATSKVIEVLAELKQLRKFLVFEVGQRRKTGCAKPMILAQSKPSVTEIARSIGFNPNRARNVRRRA